MMQMGLYCRTCTGGCPAPLQWRECCASAPPLSSRSAVLMASSSKMNSMTTWCTSLPAPPTPPLPSTSASPALRALPPPRTRPPCCRWCSSTPCWFPGLCSRLSLCSSRAQMGICCRPCLSPRPGQLHGQCQNLTLGVAATCCHSSAVQCDRKIHSCMYLHHHLGSTSTAKHCNMSGLHTAAKDICQQKSAQ